VNEDPGSYEGWYNLAVLRIEQFKDSDGAMDAAQHALALKSTGEIHNVLGDICEAQAHYTDALNHYQEAVRLDPNNDKFAFDFGAELLLHENYDAALTVYRAAVAQFPKSARIRLGLGTAEFMRGKTDESVGEFLKAVDLAPEFEPGYMFLGEAFSASETQSKEAVAKLAYVAGKRRKSFDAQYYYGAALVKEMDDSGDLRNADLAFAALRRAQVLRSEDARVYYQLGELFRVRNETRQAVPYYQKSAALDPNFPEPLYKLGQAYVRLGRAEDAKQTFARHRELAAKTEANLTRRFGEIQSFVLEMRKTQ
jgi:tetratricopeptide (TPR) repeat protein